MSFILDALKKSETDRQRQNGPALFEVRMAPPKTGLPLWAIGLGGLLAVNLVIGGIRARWRLRPPVWWWLYYRVGGRLPAKWRPWVLHDLTDPGWRRRIVANRLSTGLIAVLLANVVGRAIVHSPTVRHGAVSSL